MDAAYPRYSTSHALLEAALLSAKERRHALCARAGQSRG